jgi:hypothetical protein
MQDLLVHRARVIEFSSYTVHVILLLAVDHVRQ